MTQTDTNAGQRDFWNGNPARNWVDHDAALEQVHGALTPRILAHAAPKPGETVYDIGCGSGAVAQAILRAAPGARVTGVDISAPLLALARANCDPQIAFVEDDAQTHAFPPGDADLIVSRFGVMFFADPVAAFANLLGALRPGGRLCVACWGPLERNPWFDGPRRAVEAHYGPQPRSEPGAPGPMAFCDPDHVTGILTEAGFAKTQVRSEDLIFTHPQGATGAARLMSHVGPIGKAVRENGGTSTDLDRLADSLARIFKAHEGENGFALPAHIHFYLGERPG